MIDILTDDPHLPKLIDLLLEYEMEAIGLWLELGVDTMGFHTDIGTQNALMISPEKFRQYIKPMFKQLFMTCRDAGACVHLSSDGCLLSIVDDLIECGVTSHDPQLRANTLDGIERCYKGKLCVNADLDRQMFAFCTPALSLLIKSYHDFDSAHEASRLPPVCPAPAPGAPTRRITCRSTLKRTNENETYVDNFLSIFGRQGPTRNEEPDT